MDDGLDLIGDRAMECAGSESLPVNLQQVSLMEKWLWVHRK